MICNDMAFPENMTCNDYKHYYGCRALFDCKPENRNCDWALSRFEQKEKNDWEAKENEITDLCMSVFRKLGFKGKAVEKDKNFEYFLCSYGSGMILEKILTSREVFQYVQQYENNTTSNYILISMNMDNIFKEKFGMRLDFVSKSWYIEKCKRKVTP